MPSTEIIVGIPRLSVYNDESSLDVGSRQSRGRQHRAVGTIVCNLTTSIQYWQTMHLHQRFHGRRAQLISRGCRHQRVDVVRIICRVPLTNWRGRLWVCSANVLLRAPTTIKSATHPGMHPEGLSLSVTAAAVNGQHVLPIGQMPPPPDAGHCCWANTSSGRNAEASDNDVRARNKGSMSRGSCYSESSGQQNDERMSTKRMRGRRLDSLDRQNSPNAFVSDLAANSAATVCRTCMVTGNISVKRQQRASAQADLSSQTAS